ncbi:MAG TPA: winged helix-turn-helix domain-containing protein [Acidimicrobiia bacterium]
MPDRFPDYELEDVLRLERPEQMAALFDETRNLIVGILNDKAATTSQIADALGRPKGTIGYHMKVLEDAGLVRVVRTEKVRALEAKYYGRTARTFDLSGAVDAEFVGIAIARAVEEMSAGHGEDHEIPGMSTVRYVRIPEERAREWQERLLELAQEFIDEERGGDRVYGLMVALFPTRRPYIP